MTEITVECIPFKKGTLKQEEINSFREDIDDSFELELKRKIEKIFRNAEIKINLNEIFNE